MAEATHRNSLAAEYLDLITAAMAENQAFVRRNAEETYNQVIRLSNDAINHLSLVLDKESPAEEYVRSAMAFFVNHSLMPLSYAIYVDLLAGNLPACYLSLRLMLETLVECYVADVRYPDKPFFHERLKALDAEEELSTSKLMKELGKDLGLDRKFVALWGKLSRNWLHASGIERGIVANILEHGDVPPWGLVIPMAYRKTHLSGIRELGKRVSEFRNLLSASVASYRGETGVN